MKPPIAFSTQDAVLAFALENAGVPMHTPPTNTYTADILFTAGGGIKDGAGKVIRSSRFAGLSPWQAAQKAWKENVRGLVEYWYEKTPELPHLLKAFTEQEEEVKREDENRDAGERVREIMALASGRNPETNQPVPPMDEREAIVRILCIIGKGRKGYVNLWRSQVPRFRVRRKGEVTTVGNKTKIPGAIDLPLTADEKTRKKLGYHE